MNDTEKLLAEIEAGLGQRGDHWFEYEAMDQAYGWLLKLVEIVREQQKEIECEYTLKQAARLEAVTLQRQLDRQQDGIDYTKGKLVGLAERYQAELKEMRGDLVELLRYVDAYETGDGICRGEAHYFKLRAKYLEVKP